MITIILQDGIIKINAKGTRSFLLRDFTVITKAVFDEVSEITKDAPIAKMEFVNIVTELLRDFIHS